MQNKALLTKCFKIYFCTENIFLYISLQVTWGCCSLQILIHWLWDRPETLRFWQLPGSAGEVRETKTKKWEGNWDKWREKEKKTVCIGGHWVLKQWSENKGRERMCIQDTFTNTHTTNNHQITYPFHGLFRSTLKTLKRCYSANRKSTWKYQNHARRCFWPLHPRYSLASDLRILKRSMFQSCLLLPLRSFQKWWKWPWFTLLKVCICACETVLKVCLSPPILNKKLLPSPCDL